MRRLQITKAEANEVNSVHFGEALLGGLNSVTELLQTFWKIEGKGIISEICRELVFVLAHASKLAAEYCVSSPDFEWNESIAKALSKAIGIVCYGEHLPLQDRVDRKWDELKCIPFETSWLSHDLALLAQRTFNCVVSTNVSLFSGWNKSEFSVRLLDEGSYNFFGVVLEKGYVAGCLSTEIEEELAYQWVLLKDALPKELSFGFPRRLSILRETPWYQKMHERHKKGTTQPVVFHGEDKCLEALLHFSRVCIVVGKESEVPTKFLYMALSVLMPLSQFCLNELLWETSVGKSSSRAATFQPWIAASGQENRQEPAPKKKRVRSLRS